MDALGNFIQIAYAPLDVSVLRIDLSGQLTPMGTPSATVTVVRELSIMTSAQPVVVSHVAPLHAQALSMTRSVEPADVALSHELQVHAATCVQACLTMYGCTLPHMLCPGAPHSWCIKLTCKVVLAVQDIALVEPRAGPLGTDTLDAGDLTPRHCVLLRAGGLMSLLDMDKG